MNFTNALLTPRRLLLLVCLLSALWLPLFLYTPAYAQGIGDGLVGYWPFDEGSGSTSADQSGSGNTATLYSASGFTPNVAPTNDANPSALLSADKANSYATAAGNNIDNLQQFTIAFWVRINVAPTTRLMTFLKLNNGKANFGLFAGGNLYFEMKSKLAARRLFKLGSNVTDGGYHHIVGSYNGVTMRFYYDGALASEMSISDVLDAGQGVIFSASDTPFDGSLDDVRIYNRALATSEINALVYNCNNAQGIPASECRALVTFATNTNVGQWMVATGWLVTNTPCTWFGVTCDNGHVTWLSLPQNGLSGTLPTALGNFSELAVLNLTYNQLTGELPLALGSLGKLKWLTLSSNQLSGQLPATLGNLSYLGILRLDNNRLRGVIPSQLVNLTNLLTANALGLDLGYNSLTAGDPVLVNFLNTQQPNWAATQTTPPSNLQATVASATSVALTWTPIPYTADGGYYEVLAMPQGGNLFQAVGKTVDKKATGFTVTGLTTGQGYAFVVRTFTPKHGLQQNDLLSDSTDPVAITVTSNQPPVAVGDSYTTTQETPLSVDAAHGLLANDRDPEGNPLSIGSGPGPTSRLKFALKPDGSFTYTPVAGFVGTETFTYQASDGQALSNQATVAFQVKAKPVNNPATITIALDVQPDSVTNFNFTGSLGAFLLDDITPQDGDAYNNSKTFTVPAGVYTVTEILPTGYLDANISCNPPASAIADLTKHQLVLTASSGGNITCTFVAQRAGQIIAGKYNDHNRNHQRNSADEWLNGWQMQLHSPFNPVVATQATAGEGRTVFNNLLAGQYTACELQQTGWFAITPNVQNTTYSTPCYTVNVASGQAVWVRFGNSNTPSINAADVTPVEDIVVCDLPATDDDGNIIAVERDPWEEEEQAGTVTFLPFIQR